MILRRCISCPSNGRAQRLVDKTTIALSIDLALAPYQPPEIWLNIFGFAAANHDGAEASKFCFTGRQVCCNWRQTVAEAYLKAIIRDQHERSVVFEELDTTFDVYATCKRMIDEDCVVFRYQDSPEDYYTCNGSTCACDGLWRAQLGTELDCHLGRHHVCGEAQHFQETSHGVLMFGAYGDAEMVAFKDDSGKGEINFDWRETLTQFCGEHALVANLGPSNTQRRRSAQRTMVANLSKLSSGEVTIIRDLVQLHHDQQPAPSMKSLQDLETLTQAVLPDAWVSGHLRGDDQYEDGSGTFLKTIFRGPLCAAQHEGFAALRRFQCRRYYEERCGCQHEGLASDAEEEEQERIEEHRKGDDLR